MKKSIALLLSFVMILSGALAACTNPGTGGTTNDSSSNLSDSEEIFGKETITVTDENGEESTTTVNVKYGKDENGNTVAYVLDENGEVMTDENGEPVTVDTTFVFDEDKTNGETEFVPTEDVSITDLTTNPDNTQGDSGETTSPELTTNGGTDVPDVDDDGDEVIFSTDDLNKISSLLNIPNIYKYNYSASNVPAELATHVAVSVLHRSSTETTFASGTVVLELFKYFGQTVVNFKSECNSAAAKSGAPITYVSSNDVFQSPSVESETHQVTITKVESLGGNNYYKVTGTVKAISDDCNVKNVTAVVQKNKLDTNYGFSVKGLQWSK